MKRWTLYEGVGMILLLLFLALMGGCQMGGEEALKDTPVTANAEPTGGPIEDQVTAAPTPSTVPTSEPTDDPTPEPSPTLKPTFIPESTPLVITQAQLEEGEVDGFFDDALFVGDSITKCLSGFVRRMRVSDANYLGKAQFLGTYSMTVWQASRNESVFEYRGQLISVTKGIQLTGAKKIFILLGVNDIWFRDWDEVTGYFVDLFNLIRRELPEAEIIVQGVLPVSEYHCRNHELDIDHWNSFNGILERVCAENEVDFFSFAAQLKDERGYLNPALAEGDIHPNDAGDRIWVRALRTYAAQRMYPGAVIEPVAKETEENDR